MAGFSLDACTATVRTDEPDPVSASPQFFDQRRQQLDVFETQLRSLVDKLASANKARSGLQASIAELQSAFITLSQCDLSSSLRKLYDQAATVQQKLHDLASSQTDHDERVGSLLSVAESYARMCASAKVSATTLERLLGGPAHSPHFSVAGRLRCARQGVPHVASRRVARAQTSRCAREGQTERPHPFGAYEPVCRRDRRCESGSSARIAQMAGEGRVGRRA